MIRVSITENAVNVTGHADYAPRGHDIVCAAVSAIVQTAILGLEAIAQQYPDHVCVEVDDQRVHGRGFPAAGSEGSNADDTEGADHYGEREPQVPTAGAQEPAPTAAP